MSLSFPEIMARVTIGGILAAGVVALLLPVAALFGIRAWKRSRVSPDEMERRRRATLHAHGKMGDATLLDLRENLLVYSYEVRGVEYTASQDVTTLRALLPSDSSAVNGVVFVKYDARNPANSMVLSEQWSGLRKSRAVERSPLPG